MVMHDPKVFNDAILHDMATAMLTGRPVVLDNGILNPRAVFGKDHHAALKWHLDRSAARGFPPEECLRIRIRRMDQLWQCQKIAKLYGNTKSVVLHNSGTSLSVLHKARIDRSSLFDAAAARYAKAGGKKPQRRVWLVKAKLDKNHIPHGAVDLRRAWPCQTIPVERANGSTLFITPVLVTSSPSVSSDLMLRMIDWPKLYCAAPIDEAVIGRTLYHLEQRQRRGEIRGAIHMDVPFSVEKVNQLRGIPKPELPANLPPVPCAGNMAPRRKAWWHDL